MIIIATGGLAQAGKTTFCENVDDHISHHLEHHAVERLSFADPIRSALAEMGVTKEKHGMLYRRMAQWLGTDCLRAEDDNWWVSLMNERLKDLVLEETEIREMGLPRYETVVLIDDVRFQNEVDLVHRWGGHMVFIDAAKRTDPPTEDWQKHPSERLALDYMDIEAGLPDETFDLTITNNGTKEAFAIVSQDSYPELL